MRTFFSSKAENFRTNFVFEQCGSSKTETTKTFTKENKNRIVPTANLTKLTQKAMPLTELQIKTANFTKLTQKAKEFLRKP